jgi:hypothetical protein
VDLIDKNLAAEVATGPGETGKIAGILERSGSNVKIRYGFNSGGYENSVYFITGDGEALHIDTVISLIGEVDFTDPFDPQWHLTGYQVNYEDGDLRDAHTGATIPAAYL